MPGDRRHKAGGRPVRYRALLAKVVLVRTLFLFLAACSGGDGDSAAVNDSAAGTAETVDPLSWSVDQPGPYNVGHQRIDVSYTTALGDVRTIPVDVWYPTNDETGDPVKYINIYIDSDSLGGATPAPSVYDGGYPVMVYSHGYQGFGGTSAFLMRHMASHGWVAIGPDHVGNLLSDHVEPLPTAHFVYKAQDTSAALDAVAEQAEEILGGAIASDRVALSGHSYGVYTTWTNGGATMDADQIAAACDGGDGFETRSCTADEQAAMLSGQLDDPRVVAAIPMAGTIRRVLFGDNGHASVHAPYLSLTGSLDGHDGAQSQFDSVDGLDFTWVELEGGCHQTFALGTCVTLDIDVGFSIVNTYALAFSRRHVLGDESSEVVGILDGTQAVSDLASLQVR